MDDDDDAWSYKFPSSSDLLPIRARSQSTLRAPLKDPNMIVMPADSDSDLSLSDSNLSNGDDENARIEVEDADQSATSENVLSSTVAAEQAKVSTESLLSKKLALVVVAPPARNSLTPLYAPAPGLLQPAFMLKSGPANPQTTKEEANSIILKETNTNALAINTTGISDTSGMSPPLTPTTKHDFSNSVRIWQQQQQQSAELEDKQDESLELVSEEASFFRKTFGNLASSPIFNPSSSAQLDSRVDPPDNVASPKIITYRKTSHQRTESENYDNGLRQERFDPKLYVNEKYGDTIYRYATMKRNVDFHQLFRSLDLTDRLLDDFACALSREILLQGRIYVTEHSVCFNLNLLGWVTSLVVPFADIVRIDKKSTAGLFPNGISIETADAKHNFASFLSRDSTFEFIRTIWLTSTGKNLEDLDQLAPDVSSVSSEDQKLNNARKISNFILSIDDDEHNLLLWDKNGLDYEDEDASEDGEEDDYSDDDSEEDNESDASKEAKIPHDSPIESSDSKEEKLSSYNELLTLGTQLRKLKDDSGYKNLGPDVHAPTKVTQQFSDCDSEIELCNESINAPMGVVFDIMFGNNDTSFQRQFLENHDASEIDQFDAFHPIEDEPTKLERTYTYRRALGYSIGPKSTKCEVSEVVEHLNFADYIVVLNTTSTPDVPSGGSFSVKTRYYFTWGEANMTQLRMAYFVKWTGRSWIKNVVEKLTLSAQIAVTKDMIKELNEEIAKHTVSVSGPVEVTQREREPDRKPSVTKTRKKKSKTPKAKKITSTPKSTNWLLTIGIIFGIFMLTAILFTQVMLVRSLGETRELVSRQMVITTNLLGLLSSEHHGWWEKMKTSHGDSKQELASYYARQALQLLVDESSDPNLKALAANLL